MQNVSVCLSIKNLSKAFGPKKVHRDVSLDLIQGEMLGLFGGSGTGKSVILRTLIGLESPDSGQILFKGKDLTNLTERQWIEYRKRIAYVFQNGALFDSLTVEENLAYPLREHTDLSPAQIHQKVNQMLLLVDMVGTNQLLPGSLSGGMQKRAGLARAIILEPEVILYDEPTAGLDPGNTKRLIANIKSLKSRGSTGIFVTHDIPSAFEICDRIAILHEGKIRIIAQTDQIKNTKDPWVRAFIEGHLDFEEIPQTPEAPK